MKICEIWLKSIFSLIFDLFSFFLFDNFVQVLSQRFERHIGHHHFMYSFKKLKTKIDRSHINMDIVNLKMYKIRPFSTYIQIPLEFMFTSFIGVSSCYFVVRSNLKLDIIESTKSTVFHKLRPLLKIKQSS